jgi:hypothetical protein
MTGPGSFEATLYRELRALTRRAGLNRTQLPAEIAGTQLEAMLGLRGQPWESVRATLREHVRGVSATMSPEHRLALEVAFGIHARAGQPMLDQRIDWLARGLYCSERTVRRRIAAALQVLARATAAMPNGPASDEAVSEVGWRIRRVSILLRLDTAGPELHQSRQIVVERDGLDRIIGRFTLPRQPEDTSADRTPTVEVLYGGQLGEVARIGDEYFRYELRLPRALAAGDTHEYGVAYRLPPAAPMAPYVALVPLFNTYEFCQVRVRFDMRRVPVSIWRLAHVPPPVLAAAVPGENRLKVDGSGEVHVEFVRPGQGLGYGVAWEFADDIDRPS